jgi:L,D-peptidoglycan transpeptidase YkuD (ErfK/YbiS/YcfS/YnhG family)
MSLAALAVAGALLCPGPANAQQLVTVQAHTGVTIASLSLWQRRGACFRRVAGPWTANLGRSGLSSHKREGDGSTPTGTYRLGATMYGIARNPGVKFTYHRLVCGDWWDEDARSPAYNTFQHVACGQTPGFGGGSEALWQLTGPYPSFAVIEYNSVPVVAGAGSAIFIHADTGSSTAGCVSVAHSELDTLLSWLDPRAKPLVVMGPDSEITRF